MLDENGNAVIGDHKEIRITHDPSDFYKFTITTENGTQYIFDKPENTAFSGSSTSSGTSAMYLSRIVSRTGKEIIDFSYVDEMIKYLSLPRPTKYISPPNVVVTSSPSLAFGVTVINGKRLTQITTNFGQNLEFIASPDAREDLAPVDASLAPKALQQVRYFDQNNVTKKRFNFIYETVQTLAPYTPKGAGDPPVDNTTNYSNYRLYLKSVQEEGTSSGKHPPYAFSYFGRTAENKDLLPNTLSAAQDHWGYYNGANNIDLWPGYSGPFGTYDIRMNVPIHCFQYIFSLPTFSVFGADREPHDPFMKYGALVSIAYPTGGKTNFVFEPHRYMHNNNVGGPVTKTVEAVAQTYLPGNGSELQNSATIDMEGTLDNHFSFQFEVTCWDPNTHEPMDCSSTGAQVNFDKFQGNSVSLFNSSNQEIMAAKWTPGDGGFWIYRNGLVDNQIGRLMPDASGFITLDINNVVTIPGEYTVKSTKDPDGDTDVFGWFYYPQEVPIQYESEAPMGGGLRIKKIENFNEVNVSTGAKTYEYGLGVLLDRANYSTYTFLPQGHPSFFQRCDVENQGIDPKLYLEVGAGSYTQLGYTQGSSIGYKTAIEKQMGNGSIEYEYTTGIEYPDNADSESNVVTNLFWIDDPSVNDMWDFTFTGAKPVWPFISQDNLDRKRGFLKSVSYKNQAGQEVMYTENEPIMTDAVKVYGMRVLPYTPNVDWMYSVYKYSSGFVNVAKSIEHKGVLPSLGEIVQTTIFSYASSYHKLLTKKATLVSDGSVLSTEYFYPDDYSEVTDANHVITMMKSSNLHIIGTPVETRTYRDGNIVSGLLNVPAKYNKSGGGFFVSPGAFFTIKLGISNPSSPRLSDPTSVDEATFIKQGEFLYDDKANLVQVTPKEGVRLAFNWEEHNAFPIAKTINAPTADVFYNGFESNGVSESTAHSGVRYWNSGTYNLLTDGNFTPGSTSGLKMTYWYWNNSTWNFSGVVDFNNIINQGTRLDDIRVFPQSAQMITYSYDPLVGITSIIDQNNIITHNRYDEFGRLQLVKDLDANIVKQYKYHYMGEE